MSLALVLFSHGRVLTRSPELSRRAELSVTSSGPDGQDRLQGRLQEPCITGLQLEWAGVAGSSGLQLGVKYDHTEEWQGVREVRFSSGVFDLLNIGRFAGFSLSGDCSHNFERQETGVELTLVEPTGTILAVACEPSGSVTEVSAFRRAGPVNLQPRWLAKANVLRLHIGRGGTFRRCPLSMQWDVPLGKEGRSEFELKMRRGLGQGRQLRAVWLATKGAVLMELEDRASDRDATWVARARAPYRQGDLGHLSMPELTLKRRWSW